MSLRDNPLGELKVPLTWAGAIALVVAAVAATAILLADRRETFKAEAYGATRRASDTVLAPVGDVLAAPGRWTGAGVDTVRDYFGAASENRQLKAELREMRQWRDVAIALKNENERYRTVLGLKTDPPIPMVAARIVTDSRGPFADTRLANAGSERGVKAGNPVMSENGLVGRVIGVTSGASRVLLLTDIASRTPVMIDRTNARAILTGDGGPNPRLDYLRGRDPIREGDRLLTSGDGGVLPRGLPVGTATRGLPGRDRLRAHPALPGLPPGREPEAAEPDADAPAPPGRRHPARHAAEARSARARSDDGGSGRFGQGACAEDRGCKGRHLGQRRQAGDQTGSPEAKGRRRLDAQSCIAQTRRVQAGCIQGLDDRCGRAEGRQTDGA